MSGEPDDFFQCVICPACSKAMYAEQIDWFGEWVNSWYCEDEECEYSE